MDIDTIIRLAQLYAVHAGRRLSTVSSDAVNDRKWLVNLQSGKAGCTVDRLARAASWFSEKWPADLAWPADIPRPPKSKEAA